MLLEQRAHASRERRGVLPAAGDAILNRVDKGEHAGQEEHACIRSALPVVVGIVGRRRADDALDGNADVGATLEEAQEYFLAVVGGVGVVAAAEDMQDAEGGEEWCGCVVCARERGYDVGGATGVQAEDAHRGHAAEEARPGASAEEAVPGVRARAGEGEVGEM